MRRLARRQPRVLIDALHSLAKSRILLQVNVLAVQKVSVNRRQLFVIKLFTVLYLLQLTATVALGKHALKLSLQEMNLFARAALDKIPHPLSVLIVAFLNSGLEFTSNASGGIGICAEFSLRWIRIQIN